MRTSSWVSLAVFLALPAATFQPPCPIPWVEGHRQKMCRKGA